MPGFAEQPVTISVSVNVVPRDRRQDGSPDQKVRTELVYQQVQGSKRRAADALPDGDGAAARVAYDSAGSQLDELLLTWPSPEIAEEREIIGSAQPRRNRRGRLDGEVQPHGPVAQEPQARPTRPWDVRPSGHAAAARRDTRG